MTSPAPQAAERSTIGSLATVALRLSRALGVLCVAVGLAGIAALLPGLQRLAQPLAGWPALTPLAAAALAAVGIALTDFLRRRYHTAVVASSLATLTGLTALAAQFASIPLPAGGMALASAVLLTTAAVALLLASARRRLLPEDAAIGIAGFVLLALSTTFVIARGTGVVDPVADRLVDGESLQVLVASFLVGASFVTMVWTRGLLSGDSARWLPAAIGIAGVVTVAVLWRALAARESVHLETLTRQAGEEQRRELQRQASIAALSLRRAGARRADGATEAQERHDLDELQRDLPGLEGSGWVSALAVPDESALNRLRDQSADSAIMKYLSRARRLPDSIVYLPLDSAGARIAVVAPACAAGRCAGAMVGILRTAWLFRSAVADTVQGYRFGIVGRAGRIAGTPSWAADDARWTQWIPSDIGSVHLTLTVWPTAGTIQRVRSQLPALVLVMGLMMSGLLPVTVALAQRALRTARDAERSRIASGLERSTDGIWDWDLRTGAAVHSDVIWRYLGYDPAAVPPIRLAWTTLVHPDDVKRVDAAIADHLAGITPSYEAEYRVLARDGSWHTIADRGRVVDRTTSGEPARMLGIKADVTAARAAQDARTAAETRIREIDNLTTMGRIAARVAHEVNNPLAGIQNAFLLIKGAVPVDHPHYSYVGAIEREIARIAAVTRQLYETYRPERDAKEEAAIGTVLGDAVAFLEQVNRSSGVKVQLGLSECPSVVPLSAAMLREIAYNLVQNAIEASPPGETVLVRPVAVDGRFELHVRDRGPGIPMAARDRVFEPFFSTKTARPHTSGMGLGLSLVRRTVLAAGGTITIEDADGGGTEFIVSLPLNGANNGAHA